MASVAHEGNPRVNSLTVTGTLDGDVFLLPLLGEDAPPGSGELPIPQESFRPSTDSPYKYEFTDFSYGVDGRNTGEGTPAAFVANPTSNAIPGSFFIDTNGLVLEYSNKDGVPLSGCLVSPPIKWASQWEDNNITTGLGAADSNLRQFPEPKDFKETWDFLQTQSDVQEGFRYGESPGNTTPGFISIEASAYVYAAALGKPFSGVAVCVHPDSTSDNFTGIAAVFNWANQTEYIVRYDGEPLNQWPPNAILATRAWGVDYEANDRIFIRASKVHSDGEWRIFWNSTTITGLNDSDIPFFDFDMRTALVNIPSSSGVDDAVIWQEVSGIVFAA